MASKQTWTLLTEEPHLYRKVLDSTPGREMYRFASIGQIVDPEDDADSDIPENNWFVASLSICMSELNHDYVKWACRMINSECSTLDDLIYIFKDREKAVTELARMIYLIRAKTMRFCQTYPSEEAAAEYLQEFMDDTCFIPVPEKNGEWIDVPDGRDGLLDNSFARELRDDKDNLAIEIVRVVGMMSLEDSCSYALLHRIVDFRAITNQRLMTALDESDLEPDEDMMKDETVKANIKYILSAAYAFWEFCNEDIYDTMFDDIEEAQDAIKKILQQKES